MAYHRTTYEIALIHRETDERYLLRYTSRRSRSGLLRATVRDETEFGERLQKALVQFTGETEFQFLDRAADGLRIGEYDIRFTGRTRIDARNGTGELLWLMDVVEAAAGEGATA